MLSSRLLEFFLDPDPICISDDLLNMCSEPFVMALDVKAA